MKTWIKIIAALLLACAVFYAGAALGYVEGWVNGMGAGLLQGSSAMAVSLMLFRSKKVEDKSAVVKMMEGALYNGVWNYALDTDSRRNVFDVKGLSRPAQAARAITIVNIYRHRYPKSFSSRPHDDSTRLIDKTLTTFAAMAPKDHPRTK